MTRSSATVGAPTAAAPVLRLAFAAPVAVISGLLLVTALVTAASAARVIAPVQELLPNSARSAPDPLPPLPAVPNPPSVSGLPNPLSPPVLVLSDRAAPAATVTPEVLP